MLLDSYRAIARAIQQEQAITPAAEWLVDNFHIVDEQLREISDDLPPGYYRKLPKLASATCKAIRACSALRGHLWRTRIAGSTRRCCAAS